MRKAGLKVRYRRAVREHGEPILFRRYTGAGPNRPVFNAEVRAIVRGYQPQEFVGGIVIGDRKVIVLVDDMNRAQIGFPTTADKLVIRGKELSIGSIDDNTLRDGTELVGYMLKVTG